MTKYKIWMSPTGCQGDHGGPQYIGEFEGETFDEACKKIDDPNLDLKPDGTWIYSYPSIWACMLFHEKN